MSTDVSGRRVMPRRRFPRVVRGLAVLALLYVFLAGVGLLETGIMALGEDVTDSLFDRVTNPLAGLFVGILATVLVQSSSVTTSTIVGLVAAGVVDVSSAVPMVMGANIGTTVTNTIVSLAHVRHSEEFRPAFSAATMHDFFNVMAVAILLPIELATRFLSRTAHELARLFSGGEELGGTFDSPLKTAVTWLVDVVKDGIDAVIGHESVGGVVAIVAGVAAIFVTLTLITRNMRILVASRIERSLNAALARSGMVGILVGTIVTVSVQSSSITTSILIPLVASGILAIRNAYPITLGANLGTTITALLAALGAGKVAGLTIALTHMLFNGVAILVIYPWSGLRYVPVVAAERLADLAIRRTSLALTYLVGFFLVVPLVGIVVLS